MSKIDPTLYLSNQKTTPTQTKDVLGKDDFLKLLITQLQYQDPLDPMKDNEYISQMATFTSLEQTQNMNSLLENFVQSQSDNQLTNYANMIGKNVQYQKTVTDDEGNSNIKMENGIVKAVNLANGVIQFLTDKGDPVKVNGIMTIAEKPSVDPFL